MRLITWPFRLVWKLLTGILELTGRLIGGSIGFVLLLVGVILTFTIVGAPVGIPLMIAGIALFIRSLF